MTGLWLFLAGVITGLAIPVIYFKCYDLMHADKDYDPY